VSSFVFKVNSIRFELNDDFSSLDVCICPESIVEQTRPLHRASNHFSLTILHYRLPPRAEVHLLAALRNIAPDPRQCSSGWLLENIFQPYGQVTWDDLINPL